MAVAASCQHAAVAGWSGREAGVWGGGGPGLIIGGGAEEGSPAHAAASATSVDRPGAPENGPPTCRVTGSRGRGSPVRRCAETGGECGGSRRRGGRCGVDSNVCRGREGGGGAGREARPRPGCTGGFAGKRQAAHPHAGSHISNYQVRIWPHSCQELHLGSRTLVCSTGCEMHISGPIS